MTEFNYGLFKKLFDNLFEFHDYIIEDEDRGGAEATDYEGNDLTACFDLSIFPQLKNIKHWGENVEMLDYFEIIKDNKIVGAKGIIILGMDWTDTENPTYYHEFGHIEKKGKVEEYVRELHLDDAVMQTFALIDKKTADQKKGSRECEQLIQKAIENSDEFTQERKNALKYRCLIEGENSEIWKVGFHQGPYQILPIAPHFIGNIHSGYVLENYLRGIQYKEIKPFEPMTEDKLEKIVISDYDGNWYNIGVVDLDPKLTAKKQEETKTRDMKQLAGKVYDNVLAGNFGEIDANILPKILPQYKPTQLAFMVLASIDTDEHVEQFGRNFIALCKQHYPKFQEAANLIERYELIKTKFSPKK